MLVYSYRCTAVAPGPILLVGGYHTIPYRQRFVNNELWPSCLRSVPLNHSTPWLVLHLPSFVLVDRNDRRNASFLYFYAFSMFDMHRTNRTPQHEKMSVTCLNMRRCQPTWCLIRRWKTWYCCPEHADMGYGFCYIQASAATKSGDGIMSLEG